MSIKDISIEDEIALGLVRNHQSSGYAVVVEAKPESPLVEAVRKEVEANVEGYEMRADYGMYRGPQGMTRGTRLSMFPKQTTLQDIAYDAFEGYFVDKYGGMPDQ